MGKQKRKTSSPLQRDEGKNPRIVEEHDEGDEETSREGPSGKTDVIGDLKDFIRAENARNNTLLSEEIRRHNEERMKALEASLSFALATNETLAKRLSEVEQRARQTEMDFYQCLKRLMSVEEQLDVAQQRELHDWLIFSGPAVPRSARYGRGENTGSLLQDMLKRLMGYELDLRQVAEVRREERQIQVRFNTVAVDSDRYFLVRNKTRLRGTGLYIRERLTPYRQKILNDLMQMKRNGQLSAVFTKDGTVFAATNQRDRPRPVRSEVALERLIRQLAERSGGQQDGTDRQSPATASRDAEATPAEPNRSSSPPEGMRSSPAEPSSAAVVLSRSPLLCAPDGCREEAEEQQRQLPESCSGTAEDRAGQQGDHGRPAPEHSAESAPPARGGDRRQATSGGDGERFGDDPGRGGGLRPSTSAATGSGTAAAAAAAGTPAVRSEGRGEVAAASSSGVRRRYGCDIRRFAVGHGTHSKSD